MSGDSRRIAFIVPGRPQSKQRPRLGRGGRVYTPKATHRYERSVASAFLVATGGRRCAGYRGPVEMSIRCVYATMHRRDLDNVVKAVCDGLNGIAYADDCQVVSIRAERCQGGEERTEIEVCYPPLAQLSL